MGAKPAPRMEGKVAEKDAEVLRKARERFVRKRRAMAEQMVPAGAALKVAIVRLYVEDWLGDVPARA
jgi:hypothetical protein